LRNWASANTFFYPRINWQTKSNNIRDIASDLNINPDTFALIDDSAFERAEVMSALPQVAPILRRKSPCA